MSYLWKITQNLLLCLRWITKMIRELLALLITGIVDLICKAASKICKKGPTGPTDLER